jgi:predicted porin
VTLGRQYDPVTDQVQPLTADATFGGIFATPGDIDNYDDSARFNNAVKWTSPVYMGLQAEAMYSFGNTAGSVGSGQTWSGALGYNNGPIGLAAGYIHIDNGNGTLVTRGIANGTNSSADSLTFSVINDGYTSARSINIARAGGTYTFGPLTAGAAYSYSTYNKDAFSTFVNNEKFHDASVFLTYQVTPPLLLAVGYNYMRALGDTSAKYHSINLGADYSLSKRTDVYATFGYQHAIGTQRATNGSLVSAEASIGSYGIPSGAGNSTQELAIVGIRHRF